MTLDELKTLNQGEVVVFTKVDEKICEYYNHQVGDELIFYCYSEGFPGKGWDGLVSFFTNSMKISYFSYKICHYIERKVTLERDIKINNLFDEKKI